MSSPVSAPPAEGSSSTAAATVAARPSRLPLGAMIQACRPRQWTKNLLVLAAPGAGGALLHAEVPERLALTFICFCALSSATYLLNDIHDLAEDRVHPRRRTRPIAAGRLPVPLAVVMAVGLVLAGLGLAFAVRPWLAAVGGAYLVLTTSYTLWWRRVAVADLAAIAGGFVLRALAGGAATNVALSRWFLLVTSFGALFVVAGKRYAELRTTGGSGRTRALLSQYSENYLRLVMGIAASVTTIAYCLWAFQRSHQARLSWYELTVIPLVLWLLRYGLLLEQGAGDAPEELVLRDRFLLIVTAAWLALFVAGVYVVA